MVLRFGEIVDTTLPGLHLKLPWPVDQVIKVPVGPPLIDGFLGVSGESIL